MKSVIALYGSTSLQKVYCEDCEAETFVRDGLKVCCGQPTFAKPGRVVRVAGAEAPRKKLSKKEQAVALEKQNRCCLYCGQEIGSTKHRDGKPFILSLHWDHITPYTWNADSSTQNYAASCQVCNRIKHNSSFRDLEEARACIGARRKSKGYDF